ncbi:TVP38/TMEM64 family protein [Clostridium paraputrificum]|uniref:TVP38/TMEM64 family protein n=1 Tax=Clostridium TaxID=1485 RepID=UPI003D33853A
MFSIESVMELFIEYSNVAIIISLILSILVSLAGVLPSIFVTGANILFFGPAEGFIISILGETIGGAITFKVYRMGLKRGIESISGRYKLLDRLVNSKGKKAGILIFEGRLLPFMPSGFVTLAASLSNVNIGTYTIATFFGKIPSIALESLISYDILNISENYLRLGITIVAVLLFVITLKIKNN